MGGRSSGVKSMKSSHRAKRQPKGDYALGYARPPKHTRFPHQKNPNRDGEMIR